MIQPIRIVLVEPEIPPNTGNVARTCVGLGLPLFLVGKLGFRLSDAEVKRAGLDYWPRLVLSHEPDADAFRTTVAAWRPILFSAHGSQSIFETDLREAGALVFGCETRGLSPEWRSLGPVVRFPMGSGIRSYNLGNTVCAAAMEWVRQTGWEPGAG